MARPWYARYPKDYVADTSHLTMTEDGAYTRLLDQYYLTGEPLPAERSRIYRCCRAMTKDERKAIDAILSQFFEQRGEAFHNFRADHEISEANRISEGRSEVGKLGAQAKARARANAKPIASAIAQPNGAAIASTVHNTQIPNATHSAGPVEIWEQVWNEGRAYLVANGQSEGDARKALMRWRQNHDELEILRALKIAKTNAVELPIPYVETLLKGKSNAKGQSGAIARIAAKVHAARAEQAGRADIREA